MVSAPIPPVIQALQKMSADHLTVLLRAVIAQDRATVYRMASLLNVEPAQLDFFVIAEAANRWLSAQAHR